jgi:hypothetical protein
MVSYYGVAQDVHVKSKRGGNRIIFQGIHQPYAQSFLGRCGTALTDQVHGGGYSDQPRETLCAAGAGDNA